jgi:hypothetical protein
VHYNSATIGYCKGRLVARYHALAHPSFSLWWAAGRRNEAESEVGLVRVVVVATKTDGCGILR